MKVIPQHISRLMSPEDRQAFGKGAMTAEDALARAEIKNERDLQRQIVALLRLKGIEPNVSRMDKRKTDAVGWPDITFAIDYYDDPSYNIPCAWEVKFGNGQLSKEQQQMHVRLSTPPNAWRIRVIRSVDEAIAELKYLGLG